MGARLNKGRRAREIPCAAAARLPAIDGVRSRWYFVLLMYPEFTKHRVYTGYICRFSLRYNPVCIFCVFFYGSGANENRIVGLWGSGPLLRRGVAGGRTPDRGDL
jgi:hypothetical protein